MPLKATSELTVNFQLRDFGPQKTLQRKLTILVMVSNTYLFFSQISHFASNRCLKFSDGIYSFQVSEIDSQENAKNRAILNG